MRISKKVAIRFLSMIMALAMCFSLSATAFATEVPNLKEEQVIVLEDEADVSVTSSNPQILLEHGIKPVRGTQVYRICPAKGTALKLRIDNSFNPDSSAIKVKVTKNGGWWPSKTETIARGQAATTYTLIGSCNGEVYTVEFEADPGYFAGVLYGA